MDLRDPERSIEKLAHAQRSLLVRRGEIEAAPSMVNVAG